ncbi:hypothetical protein [Sphingopyxis sp. H050]|jgi:hypothetical protein|nr:hypothetical protein [Sphingopyxis sp. H050]
MMQNERASAIQTMGIDKGTVEEVRKRGFSLRQIEVTLEPSVTVPERQ